MKSSTAIYWILFQMTILPLIASGVQAMGLRAYHGFIFDEKTGTCIDSYGQAGRNINYLGECGLYQAKVNENIVSIEKNNHLNGLVLSAGNLDGLELSSIQLLHAEIANVSLRGAKLKQGNLQQAVLRNIDLAGTDLEGTRFEKATFESVNLTHVSLVDCDLRGTVFRDTSLLNTELKGSIFDEYTVLPFSCNDAKTRGMIYQGQDAFFCDTSPPREMLLSSDFRKHHPGVFALVQGDHKRIFLYTSDELAITPVNPKKMTQPELDEALCAAMLGTCLTQPNRVSSRHYLNQLPAPVLEWGIEFYHTPVLEMEYLRQGRVVGYFNVIRNLELPPQNSRLLTTDLSNDLHAEWKTFVSFMSASGIPSEVFPSVQYRSILEDLKEVLLESSWDTSVVRSCARSENAPEFVCGLRFDEQANENQSRGWSEQWLNDLIRKAQLQTVTFGLVLVPSISKAFNGNFIQSVPIKNINLTTVTAGHFRRL